MIQTKSRFTTGLIASVIFLVPLITTADETARRYKTPEERRDAGQKHEITEWLQISPLIELEYSSQTFKPFELSDSTLTENSKTLQLEIEIMPTDWLTSEIVYEYDDQLDEFILDEAVAELEANDFKLELGKIYLPFGEYYSRFVTGPMLEFGETRGRGMVLAYEPDDSLEISVFIFKSKIENNIVNDDKLDWGFALNISPVESVSTGFSYLSDLSESDEKLLEDGIVYQQRVDAISAYANIEFDNFETSMEWLQALDSFSELDTDTNKPKAWNLEIAFSLHDDFQLTLRVEGSKELEDAPELQTGLAANLHATKNITATIEFLRGRFKRGLAEDINGNELDTQNQLAAQLGISF